jgi:hypothetical protein
MGDVTRCPLPLKGKRLVVEREAKKEESGCFLRALTSRRDYTFPRH